MIHRFMCAAKFAFLLSIAWGPVHAGIIVDSTVEATNGWTAAGGFSSSTTAITPGFQEGSTSSRLNSSGSANHVVSHGQFGSLVVEEGTYTAQFAIGNPSDAAFPNNQKLVLGGLNWRNTNLDDATAFSTPLPSSGQWELWSVTFAVSAGAGQLGNPLDVSFIQTVAGPASNIAFDGVGALNASGTGFLIDFTPAAPPASVPEPGSLVLMSLAGLGIADFNRRRRKSNESLCFE